jgi:dephospho-CoA kinase
MYRVGLAGPAGSGKSTVAALLAEAGCPVIDADRTAHELYVPGSELVHNIARIFGEQVLRPDGGVDRAALGKTVFGSDPAREQLNALVHPLLVAELKRRLDALEITGVPIAILDAALLLQWRADRLVECVIGVWAPRETRLARLVASGLSPELAEARVDAQMTETVLRQNSDILIENTGTTDDLRVSVARLLEQLKRRSASQ